MIDIQGHADDGWGAVADAFRTNFEQHAELGAACCVYDQGRPVVDLWGGTADRRTGRAWDRDTVALVFSTTKGATALCAHMLAERGELDLDAPVAAYWPEFAAAGKDGVLVRWLLAHQAGLPVLDAELTLEDACSWDPVIGAIEAQPPLWEPGTQHGYHAMTFGFLVGEVIRRATGRTVGTFLRDEIAAPLDLAAWIGLPEEVEPRVAPLESAPPPAELEEALAKLYEGLGIAGIAARVAAAKGIAMAQDPASLVMRGGTLGGAFPQPLTADGGHNARAVRAAEIPSSNMVADARSIARMYAATVGEVDGVRLLAPETVEAMTRTIDTKTYGLLPELEPIDIPIALGVLRPSPAMPFLGPRSFGHPGLGGSVGCADPDSGVAFGYIMNNMAWHAFDFGRASRLRDAVRACT